MDCKYCKFDCVKNGFDRKLNQRYLCLNCRRTFISVELDSVKLMREKRIVLHLILAGCSEADIAEEMEISKQLVITWCNLYLKNRKKLIVRTQKIAVSNLVTIFRGIEKSRISYLNYPRKRRF